MLSLNPWNILWTIVNLLILYLIFKKFLFQPVLNVIHAREEMIRQQFDDAAKVQENAQFMKTEYEEKLTSAKAEADQIILKAKARAEEEYNYKLELSKQETEHMLEKAKAHISSEQEQAQLAAQSEIARLAVLAARKILKTGEIHDTSSSQ